MISITAEQCPHSEFIRKHLCKYCTNKEEALDFSISARDVTILENTVLTGSLMECDFQVNETNGHCQNSESRPVYQCKLRESITDRFSRSVSNFFPTDTSIRYCNLEGTRCRTYHNVGNGHMYYQCTDIE